MTPPKIATTANPICPPKSIMKPMYLVMMSMVKNIIPRFTIFEDLFLTPYPMTARITPMNKMLSNIHSKNRPPLIPPPNKPYLDSETSVARVIRSPYTATTPMAARISLADIFPFATAIDIPIPAMIIETIAKIIMNISAPALVVASDGQRAGRRTWKLNMYVNNSM